MFSIITHKEENMKKLKQTQMMISIPTEIKMRLRRLAAERNLQNPERVTSAATLARELLLKSMENENGHKDNSNNCNGGEK